MNEQGEQYTFPLIIVLEPNEYREESLSFPFRDIVINQMSFGSKTNLPAAFLFNILIGAEQNRVFSQAVHSFAFSLNVPFRFTRPLRIPKGQQMIVQLQSQEEIDTKTISFAFDGEIFP